MSLRCFLIDQKVKEFQQETLNNKTDSNRNILEEVKDYLSCEIVFNKDRTKAWLGQPHLIKSLRSKFGDLVKSMTKYATPGTPGQGIVRPKDGDNLVGPEEHKLYRSGVGMLLYLVKHTRPDIANVVRELSKVLDGPTGAAYKETKRTIKYVLDTADYGLKVEPKFPEQGTSWEVVLYSDSDWAGDKDTRISVTGFVIFLLGVPICWKSKAQRSATLSSREAELVALSEAAKEIKFVTQVLTSMGITVKLPVTCRVDNVGAIFMAENVTTSSRTKHIDMRYRFINEYIELDFKLVIKPRVPETIFYHYRFPKISCTLEVL